MVRALKQELEEATYRAAEMEKVAMEMSSKLDEAQLQAAEARAKEEGALREMATARERAENAAARNESVGRGKHGCFGFHTPVFVRTCVAVHAKSGARLGARMWIMEPHPANAPRPLYHLPSSRESHCRYREGCIVDRLTHGARPAARYMSALFPHRGKGVE